jgi:hypothetical protein
LISDISIAADCADLATYYARLCQLQADAHGEDYLLVHHEIRRCLAESESYTELGVNQGATLAAALLCGARKVSGYDITLDHYRPAAPLFSRFAAKHGTLLRMFEQGSVADDIDPVDVLYIDTLHTENQLTLELNRHSENVQKFIICHDTNSSSGLRKAINKFLPKSKWKVVNNCREGTGFTTLSR